MAHWLKRLWRRERVSSRLTGDSLPSEARARAAMLREFAGYWIAIWDDVIVAAEETADAVFAKLDELRLPDAAVRKIPERLDGVYVGLG